MKNSKTQFFSTRQEIIKWLNKYGVKNYTINDDLSVDVNGSVDISRKNLKFIPINFRNVTGSFWCGHNKLTTLTGSPKTVGGHFSCKNNKLTNLVGSQKFIGANFICSDNSLTSLLGIKHSTFKTIYISLNVDETKNKLKELIQALKKYYTRFSQCYVLDYEEFCNTIKPILEKEILQQKLKHSQTQIPKKIFI